MKIQALLNQIIKRKKFHESLERQNTLIVTCDNLFKDNSQWSLEIKGNRHMVAAVIIQQMHEDQKLRNMIQDILIEYNNEVNRRRNSNQSQIKTK